MEGGGCGSCGGCEGSDVVVGEVVGCVVRSSNSRRLEGLCLGERLRSRLRLRSLSLHHIKYLR